MKPNRYRMIFFFFLWWARAESICGCTIRVLVQGLENDASKISVNINAGTTYFLEKKKNISCISTHKALSL